MCPPTVDVLTVDNRKQRVARAFLSRRVGDVICDFTLLSLHDMLRVSVAPETPYRSVPFAACPHIIMITTYIWAYGMMYGIWHLVTGHVAPNP